MECHERALRLNQEIGNKQGAAAAYGNLGGAYHSLSEYKRAVEYHERALKLKSGFQRKPGKMLKMSTKGVNRISSY